MSAKRRTCALCQFPDATDGLALELWGPTRRAWICESCAITIHDLMQQRQDQEVEEFLVAVLLAELANKGETT